MTENKTQATTASVDDYIAAIADELKRKDTQTLLDLLKKITGDTPVLWGDGIIGFGSYHYQYESGREGDMPLIGFSPRKREFAIYIMSGFEQLQAHLNKLGKHKAGKSCLYIKRLSDININTLSELMKESVAIIKSEQHL
ncbi:MAG: DUF1801 domain-containing protein [Arenimonas sp.]|nr:DUF1801 domain-containing protein [Arenimonas sp.]